MVCVLSLSLDSVHVYVRVHDSTFETVPITKDWLCIFGVFIFGLFDHTFRSRVTLDDQVRAI